MKINVNKICKNILWFNVIFLMFVNYICEFFNFNILIKYVSDILNFILLIFIVINIKKILNRNSIKVINFFVLCFYILIIISFIFNLYSFSLLFWGLRNISKIFIAFYSSILLFGEQDRKKFIHFLNIFYVFNFMVVLFQYFVFDYYGDAIGGFFKYGTTGGNAGLLILMLIVITLNIQKYIEKNQKILNCMFYVLSSVIIAGISELKVYYILLIMIIFFLIISSKNIFRKIPIIIISIIFLFVGINVLEAVNPEFKEFFSIERIVSYASGDDHGYSSSNDISRIRAFSQIDKLFYNKDKVNRFIGYGVGNCSPSSINAFNSSFYKKYEWLHYTWFLHSYIYLELGLVGFILFVLIFISIYFSVKKINDPSINYLLKTESIFTLLCLLLFFYNSYHLIDTGLFLYVFLSLPFINDNKEGEINE